MKSPDEISGSDPVPSSAGLVAGQAIGDGRYLLKKTLGIGGMGMVWLAHDLRLVEPVALKFLPPQIAHDRTAMEELRRETLRSRKLSHPNIVRIHDFFQSDKEPPFITMEYVDGPNLHYLRESRPLKVLTWKFLAPLIRQLCVTLDYAHGEKVVHRDIKPANLMMDGAGRLKLADFGLARVAQDSMTRLTGTVVGGGTLNFMSPQQADGKAAQIADDIYSLGATIYDLLTSRPPFYQGDIGYQVRHTRPDAMVQRLADLELSNEIPSDVSALVMACLSKDPEQRPPHCQAILAFLDASENKTQTTENSTHWITSTPPPVSQPPVPPPPVAPAAPENPPAPPPPPVEKPVQHEVHEVHEEAAPKSSASNLIVVMGLAFAMLAIVLMAGGWWYHREQKKLMADLNLPGGATNLSGATPPPSACAGGTGNLQPAAVPAVQTVYRVSDAFSKPANPNGVWSFGWVSQIGSSFNPLRYLGASKDDNNVGYCYWAAAPSAHPVVFCNTNVVQVTAGRGTGVYPPQSVWFYPGHDGQPQNFGVVRFTVPASGHYLVSTSTRGVYGDAIVGGDTDFHIVHNGTEIKGAMLSRAGLFAYSIPMQLAANDTIDFVIGRGADRRELGSGLVLDATITSLPGDAEVAPVEINGRGKTQFHLFEAFNTNANPSGPWSFGWKGDPQGDFTLLRELSNPATDNGVRIITWSIGPGQIPAVCCNTNNRAALAVFGKSVFPRNTVWFFPGTTGTHAHYGAIRFACPENLPGRYRIRCSVRGWAPTEPKGDTDFQIIARNGWVIHRYLDSNGSMEYSFNTRLQAGEPVDFLIGRGRDGLSDMSCLIINLTLTHLSK